MMPNQIPEPTEAQRLATSLILATAKRTGHGAIAEAVAHPDWPQDRADALCGQVLAEINRASVMVHFPEQVHMFDTTGPRADPLPTFQTFEVGAAPAGNWVG